MKLEKGLIHVYTGDGKGKSTAALGQAFRSCGRGLNALVLQFFKPASQESGEHALAGPEGRGLGRIEFRRGQSRHPFFDKKADREAIKTEVLDLLEDVAQEWEDWDLVVLDEVNNVLRDKFIDWTDFEAWLNRKPATVELICTGRGAPQALIDRADYVSEVKKIKHPMDQGIAARKGVEY
jgi:cob(I)alamin adenosyltransferase